MAQFPPTTTAYPVSGATPLSITIDDFWTEGYTYILNQPPSTSGLQSKHSIHPIFANTAFEHAGHLGKHMRTALVLASRFLKEDLMLDFFAQIVCGRFMVQRAMRNGKIVGETMFLQGGLGMKEREDARIWTKRVLGEMGNQYKGVRFYFPDRSGCAGVAELESSVVRTFPSIVPMLAHYVGAKLKDRVEQEPVFLRSSFVPILPADCLGDHFAPQLGINYTTVTIVPAPDAMSKAETIRPCVAFGSDIYRVIDTFMQGKRPEAQWELFCRKLARLLVGAVVRAVIFWVHRRPEEEEPLCKVAFSSSRTVEEAGSTTLP